MSMEISGNYKDYKNEYLERAQTEQDKVKRTSQEQRTEDKSEGVPIPKDEYISSEKSGSKPSGLYRLGQDENGNPKVMYDDPKRAAKAKDVQPKEEWHCIVCTLPSDRCSAIGQLSGIAFTTYFIPACTAACAGHTCVPITGISLGIL